MADIYYRAVAALFDASPEKENFTDPTEVLTSSVKLVFSWIILMPISVIVSGKLITQLLRIPGQRGQSFQIKIPLLINLRAQNDEVILGITLFIVTLATTGLVAGKAVYQVFSAGFGIDPGQFNALCIFSSFISVLLSSFLLVLTRLTGVLRRKSDPVLREYDKRIDELASRLPHVQTTDQTSVGDNAPAGHVEESNDPRD
jgi:hypothetical protein